MRVRRSPHLVAHWRRGRLIATNYATRSTSPVDAFVLQILDTARPGRAFGSCIRVSASRLLPLQVLLDRLVELGLLEREGQPTDPRVSAMSALGPWNPEAGFFHTASRDVAFATARQAARFAAHQAKRWPMPPVVKEYPVQRSSSFRRRARTASFRPCSAGRRTWRRFSSKPITRADLATLLGLTSGVQQWVTAKPRDLALKTSPSGGARHSIETYVVIRDVAQLGPGFITTRPIGMPWRRSRGRCPGKRMRQYLPNSGYFAGASAMVFLRPCSNESCGAHYSRAYRAALVEAGRLCQTFSSAATWLGLAPYCVMALADSLINTTSESMAFESPFSMQRASDARRPAQIGLRFRAGTLQVRPNPRLSR